MVMHARKRPRLNDGYYDRHDDHEKEDRYTIRGYDRKNYDRRSRDDYSGSTERQNSPRLSRKLPYIDRLQPDRDRNDRYQREGDRHRYDDKRINMYERCQGTKSVARDHYSSRLSDEISNSNSRESKEREIQRKTDQNQKDASSVSNDSSSKQSSEKDYRAEAQKSAVRVCGDWSEHISSSGKRYFYNCKTEISQWVKPKEWTLEDGPKDSRNTSSSSKLTNGGPDLNRNGSVKPYVSSTSKDSRNYHGDSNRNRSNHDRHRNLPNNQNNTVDYKRDSKPLNNRYNNHEHQRRSMSTSPTSSMDTSSPNNNHSCDQDNIANGVCNEASDDDMDISPEVSPKLTQLRENDSQSAASINSQTEETKDQSSMWGQALQTLQTLQEVLIRRNTLSQSAAPRVSESPASVTSHSPRVPVISPRVPVISPRVSVQQSPSVVPVSSASIPSSATSTDQPDGEQKPNESLNSPTASDVSTDQVKSSTPAAGSTPAVETAPTPFSIELPSSLANFYDPSLTTHISDWPAEQLELRAHIANTEGLIICAHHCGQVSADLKRDRSSVRVAEVQSTLTEHRILFLKQQVRELETGDKGFSAT